MEKVRTIFKISEGAAVEDVLKGNAPRAFALNFVVSVFLVSLAWVVYRFIRFTIAGGFLKIEGDESYSVLLGSWGELVPWLYMSLACGLVAGALAAWRVMSVANSIEDLKEVPFFVNQSPFKNMHYLVFIKPEDGAKARAYGKLKKHSGERSIELRSKDYEKLSPYMLRVSSTTY